MSAPVPALTAIHGLSARTRLINITPDYPTTSHYFCVNQGEAALCKIDPTAYYCHNNNTHLILTGTTVRFRPCAELSARDMFIESNAPVAESAAFARHRFAELPWTFPTSSTPFGCYVDITFMVSGNFDFHLVSREGGLFENTLKVEMIQYTMIDSLIPTNPSGIFAWRLSCGAACQWRRCASRR